MGEGTESAGAPAQGETQGGAATQGTEHGGAAAHTAETQAAAGAPAATGRAELTFRAAEAAYATAGIERDPARLGDALATLLLSDQNPYVVKVLRFSDEEESEVLDQRTFTGSVVSQFDHVFTYLRPVIDAPSTGLLTAGDPSYPARAVREALLNALIHRDYTYSGPTIVNVYPKHMDVISLGGLVRGLQINDLLNGVCQPRNDTLAAELADMRICRNYGHGIRAIMREYRADHISPQLRVAPSSVAVILPVVSGLVGVRDSSSDERRASATRRGEQSSGTDKPRYNTKIYRFPTGERLNAIEPLRGTPLTTSPIGAPAVPSNAPSASPGAYPAPAMPLVPSAPGAGVVPEDLPAPVTARMERSEVESATLAYLIRRGIPLRRVELQEPLNLTKNQMNYALNHLVETGLVLRMGSSRATQYMAANGTRG